MTYFFYDLGFDILCSSECGSTLGFFSQGYPDFCSTLTTLKTKSPFSSLSNAINSFCSPDNYTALWLVVYPQCRNLLRITEEYCYHLSISIHNSFFFPSFSLPDVFDKVLWYSLYAYWVRSSEKQSEYCRSFVFTIGFVLICQ